MKGITMKSNTTIKARTCSLLQGVLTLSLLTYSLGSSASCTPVPEGNVNITLPATITIQRDATPGSTLWDSGWIKATGSDRQQCTGSYLMELKPADPNLPLAPGYSNVYTTNVSGIGVKIYAGYYIAPQTASFTVPSGTAWAFYPTENYAITFIYLGGSVSGSVSLNSPLASLIRDGTTLGKINITGNSNFTKVACSLNSTSINVPLGDVFATKFTGIASTAGDKSFDLGLNCDKDARINVSLAATQNSDTSETSVLALTSAGQTGTASGVGVQLLYGGTPLKINNNILLKTSAGGQETLPFTARYYQTLTDVGVGLANSSATLNITYQ